MRDVTVLVEDGTIAEIGDSISKAASQTMDCKGKIVLPGLINTHTHLAMIMFRGYADGMKLENCLPARMYGKLTPEACYYGALLGCLEMIATGTTTFVDMHFFMEEVAKAVVKAGLRAYLSYCILGMDGSELEQQSKENTKRFANFLNELNQPEVKLAIGPHAPYSCSPELLMWAKEIAQEKNAILHTHLAETRSEQERIQKEQGMKEIEYLDKLDFLCPSLLAAHCVWLAKSEVKTLAEKHVKVSHCPVSNMKLASGGVAPVPEMLDAGVPVSLGTGSPASNDSLDMFDTMKICALATKAHRWDAEILTAQQILDFATIEAARVLKIDEKVGSVEVGKEADIIVLDANAPNLAPLRKDSLISNLVYSAKGYNVNTTIVSGKVIMENRRFLTLREHEIYEKAQENAPTLVERG
jgi:5-methylthioadenosine/S-adenosylhomocysteine deaminase